MSARPSNKLTNWLPFPLLVSFAALLGLSQTAVSQTFIDEFTVFQSATDITLGDGAVSDGTATGPSILGGQRDIGAEALTSGGDTKIEVIISSGFLFLNNNTLTTGIGTVQWDGSDQSIALVPDGLGGIDLTKGGTATALEFTAIHADLASEFTIEAYSDANNFTKVEMVFPQVELGSPVTFTIPFADLENPAQCGTSGVTCGPGAQPVDFSSLGALQIRFNSGATPIVALDHTIGPISLVEEPPLACRLTGGGVTFDDTYPYVYWDETTFVYGESSLENGEVNRYQFGGQAGASTALPPQPSGEWTHHQQDGPAGKFTFHTGTASAPEGSEIIEIVCADPGGCGPSGNPPSPAKQLDFKCIGTFKSIGNGKWAPQWLVANANVTDEGHGNKDFDGTFHLCKVNVDDNGEGPDPDEGDDNLCPPDGFELNETANCACPDFYRIRIYNGLTADQLSYLPNGDIDPDSWLGEPVIYEAEGYLGFGGNGLQLHDLTGHDQNQ